MRPEDLADALADGTLVAMFATLPREKQIEALQFALEDEADVDETAPRAELGLRLRDPELSALCSGKTIEDHHVVEDEAGRAINLTTRLNGDPSHNRGADR